MLSRRARRSLLAASATSCGWLFLSCAPFDSKDATTTATATDAASAGSDATAPLDAPVDPPSDGAILESEAGLPEAAPPQAAAPRPECVVVQEGGITVAISTTPAKPDHDAPVTFDVAGQAPYTNVELRLCTPAGPAAALTGAIATQVGFNHVWTFKRPQGLPLGTTQVSFWSDTNNNPIMGKSVRATASVTTK